jgi:glycosyltransferase involved in cell wall biosynthesis
MRILMLSWEYPPHIVGGLGKHVVDLLPALAYEEVDVCLLAPMLKDASALEQIDEHIKVCRVPISSDASLDFLSFVAQVNYELELAACRLYVHGGDFDIIHNHDWMTAAAAIHLKQQLHLPLLTTIHATERGRWQGALINEQSVRIDDIERWVSCESQHIITCSQYMALQVMHYFNTPAAKIDVVPNAIYISPAVFQSEAERLAFRRQFVADDEHLVFFVGRIVYEKGVHVLLDAWARLAGQVRGRLVIAGIGPHLEMCKTQARALGLEDQVLFAGKISDTERDHFYHAADVAVFPSLYEPFGIVALEAMAATCPVVVTQTGGLQEIVRPHETGITVPPNHIDALAWGLLHTLQHPQWARARALNALDDLKALYSWQHVAREQCAMYRQLHNSEHPELWSTESCAPPEHVLV